MWGSVVSAAKRAASHYKSHSGSHSSKSHSNRNRSHSSSSSKSNSSKMAGAITTGVLAASGVSPGVAVAAGNAVSNVVKSATDSSSSSSHKSHRSQKSSSSTNNSNSSSSSTDKGNKQDHTAVAYKPSSPSVKDTLNNYTKGIGIGTAVEKALNLPPGTGAAIGIATGGAKDTVVRKVHKDHMNDIIIESKVEYDKAKQEYDETKSEQAKLAMEAAKQKADEARKMGGTISSDTSIEEALNDKIIDAKLLYKQAQKSNNTSVMELAKQKAKKAREMGGTISEYSTLEGALNDKIISAKILYRQAEKDNNLKDMEKAKRIADRMRAYGGSITEYATLEEALNERIIQSKLEYREAAEAGNTKALEIIMKKADEARKMGGTISSDKTLEEALNERIVTAKVEYLKAQRTGDTMAMEMAKKKEDESYSLGATISKNITVEEIQNNKIIEFKEAYHKAEKAGNKEKMNEAIRKADEARENGGTISANVTLEEAKVIVNSKKDESYIFSYRNKADISKKSLINSIMMRAQKLGSKGAIEAAVKKTSKLGVGTVSTYSTNEFAQNDKILLYRISLAENLNNAKPEDIEKLRKLNTYLQDKARKQGGTISKYATMDSMIDDIIIDTKIQYAEAEKAGDKDAMAFLQNKVGQLRSMGGSISKHATLEEALNERVIQSKIEYAEAEKAGNTEEMKFLKAKADKAREMGATITKYATLEDALNLREIQCKREHDRAQKVNDTESMAFLEKRADKAREMGATIPKEATLEEALDRGILIAKKEDKVASENGDMEAKQKAHLRADNYREDGGNISENTSLEEIENANKPKVESKENNQSTVVKKSKNPYNIETGKFNKKVKEIQIYLKMLGGNVGPHGTDGKWGDDTEDALRKFELKYNLLETNYVDKETFESLKEVIVKETQARLIKLGYNVGPHGIDGKFGDDTERALRKFQKKVSIIETGIIDEGTLIYLTKLIPNIDTPNETNESTKTNNKIVEIKAGDSVIIRAMNGENFNGKFKEITKDGKKYLYPEAEDLEAFGNANLTLFKKCEISYIIPIQDNNINNSNKPKDGNSTTITATNGKKFKAKWVKYEEGGKEKFARIPDDPAAYANACKSKLNDHATLDAIGAADILTGGGLTIGDGADAANAIFYTIEGNPEDAYISVAAVFVDGASGARYADDVIEGMGNTITGLTRDEARNAVQGVLRNGEFGLDDLKSMIPDGVENTFKATDRIADGQKYVFELADGQKATIRWHAPDPEAAIKYPDSASGTRWTAQIKVGNKSLGADGKWYKNQSLNIVHIPIEGM